MLGEGRPRVDLEDIHEARGVTAFAKETLMPALYEVCGADVCCEQMACLYPLKTSSLDHNNNNQSL
jgi:hypothetical protein